MNDDQKQKIKEVELALSGESVLDWYNKKKKDKVFVYQDSKDRIEETFRLEMQELDAELHDLQKSCKHVDDGGMFEGRCKKCGLMFG